MSRNMDLIRWTLLALFLMAGCSGEEDNISSTQDTSTSPDSPDPDADGAAMCGIVYNEQYGELTSLHTQCEGEIGCVDLGEYYEVGCGFGDRHHCSYCYNEQCIRAFFQHECERTKDTWQNPNTGTDTDSDTNSNIVPDGDRDLNDDMTDLDPITPTNTEHFNAPTDLLAANYGDWQVLHPERASRIDVGITRENWLAVEPVALEQNAWFQDAYGPLVYRTVTGDFAVVTHLRVVNRDNTDQPPSKDFNAGGFVIRDPAGTHNGDENWVMYNMGAQGPPGVNYGREIKKTLNSNSDLFINPQQDIDTYLKVCRIGSRFHFFYWSSVDQTWHEEQFFNNVQIDGALTTTFTPAGSEITPEIGPIPDPGTASPLSFDHPTLPATLQVGVMGHAWSGAFDVRAEFDFVSFSADAPTSYSECASMFPNPTEL
jgi:hypothetical protein